MALPTTITGISTAIAPVGPYGIGVIDTGAGSGHYLGFGQALTGVSADKATQTFTTDSAQTKVYAIKVAFQKHSAPTDNLQCDIFAVDGGGLPTGSSLGTSGTFAGSGLSAVADTTVVFSFATAVSVSPGTQYAAVFSRTGALDSNNYYLIGYNNLNADVYSGGSLFRELNTGWENQNTDAGMQIYGNGIATQFYFIGATSGGTTSLQAQKATDPTSGFSNIGTGPASGPVNSISGYQVGDVIHCVYTRTVGGASVDVRYATFDMSSDAWVVNDEVILSAATTTGQTGALQKAASVVVRSTGEVVAFFNGAQTKTAGTNRARVYYSRRTAVNTWSAAVEVDASTAADNVNPLALLDPNTTDQIYFLWATPGTTLFERTLSAANALQTQQTGATNNSIPTQGVIYNNGGTTKVVVATHVGGSGTGADAVTFNGASNPTVTTRSPIVTGYLWTGRVFVDGTTVYYLALESDNDLHVSSSTDDGATWSADTNIFTGVVATANDTVLSLNGAIYQRGSSVVIPYIVNDNGTLKYNEYVVRTLTPTTTVNVTGTGATLGAGSPLLSILLTTSGIIGGFASTGAAQPPVVSYPTGAQVAASTGDAVTLFNWNSVGGSSGFSGAPYATSRQKYIIPASLTAAQRVQLSLQCSGTASDAIIEAWIGYADAGGTLSFASTPTRLTFNNGSPSKPSLFTIFKTDIVPFTYNPALGDILIQVTCSSPSSTNQNINFGDFSPTTSTGILDTTISSPSDTTFLHGSSQDSLGIAGITFFTSSVSSASSPTIQITKLLPGASAISSGGQASGSISFTFNGATFTTVAAGSIPNVGGKPTSGLNTTGAGSPRSVDIIFNPAASVSSTASGIGQAGVAVFPSGTLVTTSAKILSSETIGPQPLGTLGTTFGGSPTDTEVIFLAGSQVITSASPLTVSTATGVNLVLSSVSLTTSAAPLTDTVTIPLSSSSVAGGTGTVATINIIPKPTGASETSGAGSLFVSETINLITGSLTTSSGTLKLTDSIPLSGSGVATFVNTQFITEVINLIGASSTLGSGTTSKLEFPLVVGTNVASSANSPFISEINVLTGVSDTTSSGSAPGVPIGTPIGTGTTTSVTPIIVAITVPLTGGQVVAQAGTTVVASSSSVTALPGSAASTTGTGALSISIAKALASVLSTTSAQPITSSITFAIPGTTSTLQAGSIAPTDIISPAGVSGISNNGIFKDTITDVLNSALGTSGVQPLNTSIAIFETGAASTLQPGSVSKTDSISSTGVSGTSNTGVVKDTVLDALSSGSSTVSAQAFTVSITVSDASAGVIGQSGLLLSSESVKILGQAGTTGIASPLKSATIADLGVKVDISASLTETISKALSGVIASSGVGQVLSADAPAFASVISTSTAGILADSILEFMTGAFAQTDTNSYSFQAELLIEGAGGTSSLGLLTLSKETTTSALSVSLQTSAGFPYVTLAGTKLAKIKIKLHPSTVKFAINKQKNVIVKNISVSSKSVFPVVEKLKTPET